MPTIGIYFDDKTYAELYEKAKNEGYEKVSLFVAEIVKRWLEKNKNESEK